MSILIKNARLADNQLVNILIKDDLIYSINHKKLLADETVDARGRFVIPGLIDVHVHFRVPGGEYKEDWITGSMAAAASGITTVLDMPNNNPAITSVELLDKKRQIVRGKSYVNYGFYLGATEGNLKEIKRARGIAGVKVYLGSTTGDLLVTDYSVVRRILESTDYLVAVHAEDEWCLRKMSNSPPPRRAGKCQIAEFHNLIRPEECARSAVERVLEIVKEVKKPVYFCHVSSQLELEVLRQARSQRLPVYLEATPHHLFLNCNSTFKVNPPLRSQESQIALQRALVEGLIDVVATDHAPHTREEKQQEYTASPSGLPGLETSLPLILDYCHQGQITLMQVVELMCYNPARIFGIKKRGQIIPGYFADLVMVDFYLTKEVKNSKLYTKCGWSPFDGWRLQGWPVMTVVNGEVVFKEGRIIGKRKGTEVQISNF